MRLKPLVLVSAALLVAAVPAAQAQQQRRATTPVISLDGRYLAARVAEQDHDYDRAAEQIDQALLLAPDDPSLVYDAFRMRLYAGRFESALQLAPSVLSVKPGDGFANLVVTVQLIKRGDYRGAEQQLAKIGAENQLGPLRDYVTAWLRAGDKDFAAARTMLGKMRTPSGERTRLRAMGAGAAFSAKRRERSIALACRK